MPLPKRRELPGRFGAFFGDFPARRTTMGAA
jgi:hypothetical protein